ncbi:periplasmic heavy metal sensor [Ruegeria sp. Ofav3-42]|uniref:periplasmic heavy metal sensor n=1 Tax=Ruegeria sp. Ofav3-42 TaxID=2917759 RepID=UPI001EF68886|nr:periplasmic heavy metal sensor [Ruegeria sp. Ofav3-42]MCG7519093.1 periplasmic heavy metal sensor [Ruegeria sp. Ofav3-42]
MSDNPKPKSRWMSVLLVISLALNLLVVGVALGTVLRVKGGDHAKAPPGFGSALYRALPKDERKAMRGELFDRHRKGAKNRSQDFAQLSAALRSDPFDPAAVQALLDQQAQFMAELQDALQAQWLSRVVAMSDEERLIYAERLEDVVKRGPHGHKKKD